MDAGPMPHPSDETLSSYRSKQLDEHTAGAVSTHLDECADCRRRVVAVAGDDAARSIAGARLDAGKGEIRGPLPDVTRTYISTKAPARPAAEPLPPALAGHPDYSVKRVLGRGGMGVVYLAHNTLLGRDEVLKVVGRRILESPGALERFLREIRAVARLRHPNIVTAYSATRRGDEIVFAMELVEGLDLAKLVRSKGPIPVAHACHFIHQAALGLQHAHENGLVHRDIKPGNLMLSRVGRRATVKVLDFGLAKLSREDGGLTEEGRTLGTPDYMAPEQCIDAQSADIRADIYSLGATLYYLLTGRPPFQATSLVEIYRAHVSGTPDRLSLVRPEVPMELAAVVETMMAKEPAKRYQTPGDVARALTPFFKKGSDAPASPAAELVSPGEGADSLVDTAPTAASPSRLATDLVPTGRTMESTVRESGWDNLIVFDADEGTTDATTGGVTTPSSPWLWTSAALGVLLLSLVGAWASGLLAVQRQDGKPGGETVAEDTAERPGLFPKTVPIGVDRESATAGDKPGTGPAKDAAAEQAAAPATKVREQPGPEPPAPTNQPASSAPEPSSLPKATSSSVAEASSGFEPLFNGMDLSGWVPRGCRAADWLIQDRALFFRDPNDRSMSLNPRLTPAERRRLAFRVRDDGSGVLFTERSYYDFVLRLEFRATGSANGGIVLADLDRGDRPPRYAEFVVSLADSPGWKAGDFLSWNFANPVRLVPARSVDLKKGEAWNSLELESREGSLRLGVNGKQVEYDGLPRLDGPRRIGLRGLSGDIRYRGIEVRGRPATVDGNDGRPRLLLGSVIYADDLSDPATGWSREDIDNGPGKEPFKRDYEGGLYFLKAPPDWSGTSAWNAWGRLPQDFQFEVVGRVLGDDSRTAGGWTLILDGPNARGLQVAIDRLGSLTVEPSFWGVEKYPNDPRIGPFTHRAIRPGKEWNEVSLRVRKRRLEVFVNSVRVCEPLNLGWDLLPAQPQIAVSKPEAPSRIRAEFDAIEIRELTAEGP